MIKLLIVESPAKVKTMSKFLGKDYIIKSSIGHIRDLPTGKSTSKKATTKDKVKSTLPREEQAYQNLKEKMGLDPENHWQATYEILPGKEKVIRELKAAAKEADVVILASDLDREGEAIAWHLSELLGKHKYERIIFNSITKEAILEAIKHPKTLDYDKIHAQQTRRFLDRVVGYMVSPVLWNKITPGLSAGRVQSIALKILVEREQEIRKFLPIEYWDIYGDFVDKKKNELKFELAKYKAKKVDIKNKEQADFLTSLINEHKTFELVDIEEKESKSLPPLPLITSSLQQIASSRLGYSIKQTMSLAQNLYEQGFITYMRTDSTNISMPALVSLKKHITKTYGESYLGTGRKSSKQKFSQEAHECIRPTDVALTESSIKDEKLHKLYRLIKGYYIASQMKEATYLNSTVKLMAGELEFTAKLKSLVFDGFVKELPMLNQADKVSPPPLKKGEKWDIKKIQAIQNFTSPPSRFSEASLVSELEKSGIGRPSTYVPTISTLQERGYIKVENKRIFVEKIGELVVSFLDKQFADLMRLQFTADMEENLDKIANGELNWEATLDSFYKDLKKDIKIANEVKDTFHKSIETTIKCEKSDHMMQIKFGSTGVFLGCSGYADKKNPCKHTVNLIGQAGLADIKDEEEIAEYLSKAKKCPKCSNLLMDYMLPDYKSVIHVCGDAPLCQYYEVEKGDFTKDKPEPKVEKSNLTCDNCGEMMVRKTGRFGEYVQCESCKKTRKVLKNGEVAPMMMTPIPMTHLKCVKADDYYVLREGLAGLFLAASKFPKVRETRSPLISELKQIKSELPEKFQFVLTAPIFDDAGNPTVLGFNKTTKTYQISSIKDGKKTKFVLTYKNNKWS